MRRVCMRKKKPTNRRPKKTPQRIQRVRHARRHLYPQAQHLDSTLHEEGSPYFSQRPASIPVGEWKLNTIDLFCGAGGITEGFRRAGYACLYANDIDQWAIKTFKANHPEAVSDNRPIEEVNASAIRHELGLERGSLDVLVGGPPCQGFSINAPERFLDDPRNSLFRHYVRFLDEFGPKTLLLENVPGMLSLGGGAIFEQIKAELGKHGNN